jgi:hypothetical protein
MRPSRPMAPFASGSQAKAAASIGSLTVITGTVVSIGGAPTLWDQGHGRGLRTDRQEGRAFGPRSRPRAPNGRWLSQQDVSMRQDGSISTEADTRHAGFSVWGDRGGGGSRPRDGREIEAAEHPHP